MDKYKIIQAGDPRLSVKSLPVEDNEFGTDNLHRLVDELFGILKEKQGAGVAAPQVGVNKRIFVYGFDSNPKKPDIDSIPYTVLINPQIIPIEPHVEEGYEGCFSLGSIIASVPRYTHIRYNARDIDGNKIEGEARNYHARIIQHENDHLDGILIFERVINKRSIGFHNELAEAGVFG